MELYKDVFIDFYRGETTGMLNFFVVLVVHDTGEDGWLLRLTRRLRIIRRCVYYCSERAFMVDIPIDQFCFFKLQDTDRSST